MVDTTETDRFVQDPNQLLSLIRDVVRILESMDDRDQILAMEVQLREISTAIEKVEKKGVTSPDAWRAEKTRLAAALGSQTEPVQKLNHIANGLQDILKDINIRILRKTESPQKTRIKRSRSTSPRTKDATLRELIIEALQDLNGSATFREILNYIQDKLEGKFLPGDFENSGKMLAWQTKVSWEHSRMVKDGLLKPESKVGIWELNEVQK